MPRYWVGDEPIGLFTPPTANREQDSQSHYAHAPPMPDLDVFFLRTPELRDEDETEWYQRRRYIKVSYY